MAEIRISTELEQKNRLNDIKNEIKKEEEQREKEKKNHNFIMMYREHMPEMRWLTNKSGKASNILNFIMEHMDYQNALMCSYQVFMDYFEISSDTVRRCIKLLKDNGFIDVLKSGTSNVYIVNQEIVWSSWDNQKKYCKFSGNILISATENKDYVYRNQFDKLKVLREQENIKNENKLKKISSQQEPINPIADMEESKKESERLYREQTEKSRNNPEYAHDLALLENIERRNHEKLSRREEHEE